MEFEFTAENLFEKKCGEIFIENGFFIYKCEFCNKKFQGAIALFQEHYSKAHADILESTFVKIEKVEVTPYIEETNSLIVENDEIEIDSATEDDDANITKQNKLKKSKLRKEWKEEKVFKTRKAAMQFVNNENTWSKSYSHQVRKGTKQYYRCNQVLVRGKQCAAQIFLLEEKSTKKFRIFRSFDGHNCKEIINQRKYQKFNKNLSNEIKCKIQKLFEQELAPVVIYESLKNEYDINMRQISNYLVTLRSKFGTKNPQLRSEITTWLNSINVDSKVPNNITKAYIVSHTDNQTEFRLFISSKRLLYNSLNAKNLHSFGTKKLTWKAYFLHIIGTVDYEEKFHPYGIGVCPSNRNEDFEFIFESLRDGCLKLFDTAPNHKVLIRDTCFPLQFTFQKFYGINSISKICWDYARRKMKRKLDEFLPKDDQTKKKLMLDLDTVQLSENAIEFQDRVNQFMDKWSMCVKFCTYLFQEWVDSDNKNWYNIPMNNVCNNNALRLFINDLENDETFRERLPVEQFREKMFEWIKNWSDNEPAIDSSFFAKIIDDDAEDFINAVPLIETLNKEEDTSINECVEDKSDLSFKELEAIVERKREKKFGKQWKIEKIFQSKSEAEEAIAIEGYWGSMFKNKTKAGLKVFYRCKKVISRGKQCEAALSLLFKSDSTDVILMRSGLEHTCHQIGLKQKGIDANVKLKVEELFEMNFKPKNILDHLRENSIGPLPTLMQLNNYLNVIREGKYGSKSVDLNQIESWLIEKSNLPNHQTTMFVSAYEIQNSIFRFFLTSQKLLQNGIHLNHLQIDFINKIEWIKYPIYILGYTNQFLKFQILGIAVCYSNELDDFTFIFKSLKDSITKLCNIAIQPSVLITDSCKNIHDAFLTVFGLNLKIKICSSFVKRDLKKKATDIINGKEIISGILNDLNVIQKSSNINAFQLNINNFLEKWNQVVPEFIQYFQQEYIIYNNCWYNDYEPQVPKNNNAIEQIVKILKNEDKQRKKISLLQLETKLSKWIETWSTDPNLLYPKLEIK